MSVAEMSFQEKITWLYTAVAVCTYGTYLAIILTRAQSTPLTEVAYVRPLLWTIGACLAAMIVGCIAIALASPKDRAKTDQRDREIERFGTYVGQSFAGIFAVVALVLSITEADYFWIANAIWLGCVLSGLLGSVVKLVAYRRDFRSW